MTNKYICIVYFIVNFCPSVWCRKIIDIIQAQQQGRDLHETFHNQLERAQDGFSVVADYFGRGVFNKVTLHIHSVC